MLKIRDLDYRYFNENKYIFYQFSVTIPKNKKIALLGQNGSGKTTLLLLIDGLLKPEKGSIYWEQELLKYRPKNIKKWRERMGLTFQNPEQQLVAGTVAEDISYGLYNLQLSQQEIKERLEQILKDFDLELLANEPLHHLSLGQKRRVALAGVMALKPQLLLLDEPTTYLDQQQTNNFLLELERIYQDGTTILIATHDLNLAYQWADWFIFIHEGKVILEGEANYVFNQREILEQIKIQLPILWEVWHTLPPDFKQKNNHKLPRNIEDLKKLM
jgi:cobalt/nickel transport system ATP-binding protein